ncbi:Inositol 2-dehydrogenase/D-chiro-inositol 3-dehydrogenase [Moorella humiferrea]|uniref:Gfo/Idh/MocA family protein n=1 Tax=Neomoorella humiferrea TaxID=676965 RepID=UPI0030CB6409
MINVGIIGAGAVVRRGHLPALKDMKEINVKAIADIDENLAKNVAREFQIPSFCSEPLKIIKDPSIDLIDICTPSDTHCELIKLAAQEGKNILVEKPLTTTIEDALQAYHAVVEAGVKLNVVQNWRYFPAVFQVKERINQGYLGKIVGMEGVALTNFPTAWTRSKWLYSQGGVLFDFAPHLIDLMIWLNGSEVKAVYALGGDITGGNMGFVNHAQVIMEFDNGATATAIISWVTESFTFTVDVYGTGGNITLDVRNAHYYEMHGAQTPLDDIRRVIGKTLRVTKDILNKNYFKGAMLYYKPLIRDFIKSIKENREEPVPIRHGVMVTAVLDGAFRSLRKRQAIYLDNIFDIA